MVRILLVGSGGREDALANALLKSDRPPELFVYGSHKNPDLVSKATLITGDLQDITSIIAFAKEHNIDFCFVGPEQPLEAGISEALQKEDIPCIGPTSDCAQIETSKSFARLLFKKYDISGNPKFMVFDSTQGIGDFIDTLPCCVLKPDGLTGGKGVLVQGEHFTTKEEALTHCKAIISQHGLVVVEEKLDGQEFSLMSITDGKTVLHFPPVQDHKRALEQDKGPNTGGMGSYTDYNQLLPFLQKEDVETAQMLNEKTLHFLAQETGQSYKGILYGGFIAVRDGVKLIEYNARFGDPEALNVLTLLTTDFTALCQALIKEELDKISLGFMHQASVCKYLVPEGYPNTKTEGTIILPPPTEKIRLYHASVTDAPEGYKLEGSRSVAVVGIGNTIAEAEQACEAYIKDVKGPVRHRADIGTNKLITQRIEHMNKLRGT